MKDYTLTQLGQRVVTRAVIDAGSQRTGINPTAFFKDAEEAMNASETGPIHFEIGQRYTDSENPELVELSRDWFDSQDAED
mgnify:FL=1